jgi:hypothetical protein
MSALDAVLCEALRKFSMRLIRLFGVALTGVLLFSLSALPASARLLIEIDKSSQQMTVSRDGRELYVWPVSTGIARYDTPSGQYTPFRMEKDHFSKEWDDAPMPNSIFFTQKGHAIHGTDHVSAIGRPASHGCVRLSRAHARVLWDLVKQEGMPNTRVVLNGEVPGAGEPAVARRAPGYDDRSVYANDDWSNAQRSRRYASEPRTGYSEPRTGYWVRQPDGSQVFYDSERTVYPRQPAPPSPFFFPPRPPGW